MSRRGHHGDEPVNRPLGEQLKDEVRRTLQLLFKTVEQQAVELKLDTPITAFSMGFPVEFSTIQPQAPHIHVSNDPIRLLSQQGKHTYALPLQLESTLATDNPCALQPTLCHEPCFDETPPPIHGVSFDNLLPPQTSQWPVEALSAASQKLPVDKPAKPSFHRLSAQGFASKSHSLLERMNKIRIRHNPNLYALPLKKTPIPPHRFSLAVREKFRNVLAEKAGTPPTNIQLRIVFERMDMNLYATIQQDEQGNLLCIPKNEYLGKNLTTGPTQTTTKARQREQTGTSYLVFGIRLDNKEDIRALVPTAAIQEINKPPGDETR